MPAIGKTLLAVCLGLFAFRTYTVASASAFFALRTVDVSGASRASTEQIEAVVRRAAAPVGVWRADLEAIRTELERQPWVRGAMVARVLPSGLRVRIVERMPRAVVRTANGRLTWVDDDGVIVGPAAATDQMPAFFLRGWDEGESGAVRAENRQRVAKLLELQNEWTAAGLAERVSEVNLDDLRDVRAQLAGADSQVEVRLGKDDLTKRLRQALQALDEQRQTPRGALISYIDMTQGKRAVIGFMRAQLPAQSSEGANLNVAATSEPMVQPRAADVAVRQRASARTTPHAQTTRNARATPQPKPGPARETAHETKRAAEPPRGVEQRPRRVVLKTG
ncbi:MAG TPA: FtsQ-type POTRA domain-containing protein [Pyrinomonadaceae bacterium]|jgi:cell division protein FtsQ